MAAGSIATIRSDDVFAALRSTSRQRIGLVST
jgi:hypothetical protein